MSASRNHSTSTVCSTLCVWYKQASLLQRCVHSREQAMSGEVKTTTSRSITLCTDIEHTQGVAEHSLLAFLTVIVRAVAEFRLSGTTVRAYLPNARQTPVQHFFTQESLAALANASGFQWSDSTMSCHARANLWGEPNVPVNETGCDVIIGTAVHVTPDLHSSQAVRALLPVRYPPPPRPHNSLSRYFSAVWELLRTAIARRHKLHVCIPMLALSTPLSNAFGAYQREKQQVLSHVVPSPVTPELSGLAEAAPSCAYVFLPDDERIATPHFEQRARTILGLASAANLSCAIINILTQPKEDARRVPAVFAALRDEAAATGRGGGEVDAVRVFKRSSRASGGLTLDGTYDAQNARQRFLAASAALFISSPRTSWGDAVLQLRARRGAPTVILHHELGKQEGVGGRHLACDATWPRHAGDVTDELTCYYPSSPCARHCGAFYFGICVRRADYAKNVSDFGDAIVGPQLHAPCNEGSVYDLLSRGCCPPACSCVAQSLGVGEVSPAYACS